jgi:tRNA pseudouridine55 synthase
MQKNILLVDKPAGWTSFDVVAKIRGQLRRQQKSDVRSQGQTSEIRHQKSKIKVGHAGTLDPFATGLLVILLGDACKQAGDFLKLDKTYEFTAKLGETSTTGDPEGEKSDYRSQTSDVSGDSKGVILDSDRGSSSMDLSGASHLVPTIEDIEAALKKFTGEITQIPPIYSAIKIDGKRAYKLAREGKEVVIPPRNVQIDRLKLVSYEYPYLKAVCDVSSGTYIRSLVEDIGESLKAGAYCSQLRRTSIGQYDISDAQEIQNLKI